MLIVVSWLYDATYLFFLKNSKKESQLDGGVEGSVRTFSDICLWISFFFRIIVALVFWKDSLDYKNILGGGLDLPSSFK
jgi:hypothetical protein